MAGVEGCSLAVCAKVLPAAARLGISLASGLDMVFYLGVLMAFVSVFLSSSVSINESFPPCSISSTPTS
jgi:hypothetical protein